MLFLKAEVCSELFLKIIVTILMPTSKKKGILLTLNRCVKTIDASAMLSINRNSMHEIDNFDEKVLEKFISMK